jgi:hypothetical protein
MESTSAPIATIESTPIDELQKLVLPGSGLSKVSSRPYEDFDGSTKQIDVLHVLRAKAIIIVGKIGDDWRAEALYNDLRKTTPQNQQAFSQRARNLVIEDSTRHKFNDGAIGQEMKRLAEKARLSVPGESPHITPHRRKPLGR